jgi:pyruvate,water dikinase
MGADRHQALRFVKGRGYVTPVPLGLTPADFRVRRTAMEDLKKRLQAQDWTAWDYWGPEIERATERLAAFDREGADGPALATHLEDALAVRRRHYMLHPLCWFKPLPTYYDAFARLSGLSGDALTSAAGRLVGSGHTLLTDLVNRLYELARVARRDPEIAALVAEPPPNVYDRLAALPAAAPVLELLDDLLTRYGYHNGDGYGSEATLRTPTWRERPDRVLHVAAAYLDPDLPAPEEARARARAARDAEVEALCGASEDAGLVAEFRRELAYARKNVTVLEQHNHFIDQMGLGLLRHATLAAADWLAVQGLLAHRDEVFWLSFDEMLEALRADLPERRGGVCAALADRVAEQRERHARWTGLRPPPILGLPEARLPPRPAQEKLREPSAEGQEEWGRVVGLGASPGRYRGRARVVPDATRLPRLAPGDVLVAPNAGPLWASLIPTLGALVLDEGGLTQHAAVTAREYGVPAVVDTRNGTLRVQDGSTVTVDGTAGTVMLSDYGG